MQQVWRKRWRNAAWALLGASTLVLLVAAMYTKNNKTCNRIEVTLNGDGSNFFIDEKDVISILKTDGEIIGQQMANINLKLLESRLEKDKWISNAELFFDNKQCLQVRILEKEPVARIFTANGNSFYIDSSCRRLPLSDKLSARIPMFTSFPSDRQVLAKPDSQLLADVKELAMFIQHDEFWKAQVAQIDITANGFEMIPTIGNHVVRLGSGTDYDKKFDRLYSFYKEVWTKVGFEKYDQLDVRFNGQVVARFKGNTPMIVDTSKEIEILDRMMATNSKLVDSTTLKASSVYVVSKDTTSAATTKVTAPIAKPVINQKQNSIVSEKIKQALSTDKNLRQSSTTKSINNKPVVVKSAVKAIDVKHQQTKQQQIKEQSKTIDKMQPKAVMKKVK